MTDRKIGTVVELRFAHGLDRLAVPPALREEPRHTRQDKEKTDADRDDSRGYTIAVQKFAGRIIRCGHRERHESQLGCEYAATKVVLDHALKHHRREDPQNTAAAVRHAQHD